MTRVEYYARVRVRREPAGGWSVTFSSLLCILISDCFSFSSLKYNRRFFSSSYLLVNN